MIRVVISSMFLHYFVDPDPRVKTFEKKGTTEKGVTKCEMRDFGNSAHLHWRLGGRGVLEKSIVPSKTVLEDLE